MELHIRELDLNMIQPNLATMDNPDQGGSKIVVIGKPGCFGKDTLIRMFSQQDVVTKYIQDLRAGERIYGGDGKTVTTVLETSTGKDWMYKIQWGSSNEIIVNEQHILVLGKKNGRKITTHDMTLVDYMSQTRIGADGIDEYKWIVYEAPVFKLFDFQIHDMNTIDTYYGITVDDPKQRFLLADGSIVHNTGKCLGYDTMVRTDDGDAMPCQALKKTTHLRGFPDRSCKIREISHGEAILFEVVYTSRGNGTKRFRATPNHILALVRRSSAMSFLLSDVKNAHFLEIQIDTILKFPDILRDFCGYDCDGNMYDVELFEESVESPFAGFEIDGNGLFVLADGIVTHNTTLITSLLYEKRQIFPIAMVMSGTEDSNGHYKKIIPSTFVYNKLHEKKISDFIVRQKVAKKHLPNPWSVLLLDDCTDDPKLFNKSLFQGLYKNGRHWKMLFILSLQYCMDVKPVIRTNVDGVFILRETNLRNRRSLWENYAGVIPDFQTFCVVMDEITDNYTALYIHNAVQSNRLEDCVFWYRARKVPDDFRFGSKDAWRFHKNRFDPLYKDPFI